ncbi:hypothetical protein DAI22_06g123050 [Oryza sativa Japonica Group]|nr:hypothetical protein DAI22_06g123050 [Oryza sativa Japonica Group]
MSSTACHLTCSRRSTTRRSSEDRSPKLSPSQRRGPRSTARRRRRGRRRRRRRLCSPQAWTDGDEPDDEARCAEVQLLPPFWDEVAPCRRRRPL